MDPKVLIEQIRAGTAPQNVRDYAARGLLPVLHDDLISIQVLLSKDADTSIATTARNSLHSVSEVTWTRLLEKSNPDAEVLSYCLYEPSFPQSLKEKIVLNHSAPDEVISQVAAREKGLILDLIIQNQVRLLRDAEILRALEENADLTIDQRRRIEEFKTEFVFKKQAQRHEERVEEIESATLEDLLAQIPTLDTEAIRMIREADEQQQAPTEEQVQQQIQSLLSTEDVSDISSEKLTTYQRVLRMKPGEKIRIALLGTKDERSILIRDSNRLVASFVLRSPKLTEGEMEGFAQMRNLDSELLRQMGMQREFVKRYTVIHSLTRNPKTPSPVALNLLKLLRVMDLRNLARDRNIPEVIRRQAKRYYDMKQDGKATG